MLIISLPFTPTLKPFGEGRAVFFCNLSLQSDLVVALGYIQSQGCVVSLNKWVPEVNMFDSSVVVFDGWISITGLTFNSWDSQTFKSVGASCGE